MADYNKYPCRICNEENLMEGMRDCMECQFGREQTVSSVCARFECRYNHEEQCMINAYDSCRVRRGGD